MTGSITWNNKKQGVDQADFVCNRHPKFLSGFEIWYKPELLGQRKDIPKPDFHNEESVKNFLNEMEIRNKLIDQMPDNVIPMDFHLYEIKIGEDLMEIEVDYTWNIFGISYSGNKSVIKRFKKIARDLYCYYGVSEEDIKNRTKRYSSLVTELSS